MGNNHQEAKYAASRAAMIEDVENLLAARVDVDQIVARLGTTRGALARRLHRCGRHDLARKIDLVGPMRHRRG